jgi:hypothetical protein
MGGLIQTKGTQRLAKLFNNRFDAGGPLTAALNVKSSGNTLHPGNVLLPAAFAQASLDLLAISDLFIAQNALSGWPNDWNDFLYPSATMAATNTSNATATLQFTVAPGAPLAAGSPESVPNFIAQGAAVSNLTAAGKIPHGTTVSSVVVNVPPSPNFSVNLSAPVKVNAGDLISFAKGKHEQLVRRWRWYLGNDLLPENHTGIRSAISNALNDPTYIKITFQTVEDKQHVVVTPFSKVDNSDEFGVDMIMQILLLTQSTTAPDRLDPQ